MKSAKNSFNAIVVKTHGKLSEVLAENGARLQVVVKGKIRLKGIKSTNPLAVGDKVLLEKSAEDYLVTKIQPRQNHILKRDVHNPNKFNILAANIDQAILMVSLVPPVTSTFFIDKFLISAEAYHVPCVIFFNKIDAYNDTDLEILEEYKKIYEKIAYQTKAISSLDENYREDILKVFRNKKSFVGGHSGAGKSTLLNLISPNLRLKTQAVSEQTGRGKHTTSYSEMHQVEPNTFIIDSPGFQDLDIYDIEKKELSHFFVEMKEFLVDCKFSDCLHDKEPHCAVKSALENKEVAESRYHSYISLLNIIRSEQ